VKSATWATESGAPWHRRYVRAEWIKLRTVRRTSWLVLAAVALTIALSAAADAFVSYGAFPSIDPVKLTLVGVQLGQALVAALAVLTISSEYDTGLIRATFTAMPHRLAVLRAKVSLVTAIALLASALAVLGSFLVGRLLLPAEGYTPAHGYALLNLTSGTVLRAVAGSAIYLTLIALLSLGVATVFKETTASIGSMLGLLYLFPLLGGMVSNPYWQRLLQEIDPASAGLAVQATVGPQAFPMNPWAGLGVVAAWAAAALAAGALLVCRRDH